MIEQITKYFLNVLFALIFLMPAVIGLFGDWLFWQVVGKPDRFDYDLSQEIFIALPFLVWWLSALRKLRKSKTESIQRALIIGAIAGILTSSFLYGWLFYKGYIAQTTGVRDGAVIGAILFPLIVWGVMKIAYVISKRIGTKN